MNFLCAAERKERAWARFYTQPAACDDNPSKTTMVECANHFVRAKRQFEAGYAAGKPGAGPPEGGVEPDAGRALTAARRATLERPARRPGAVLRRQAAATAGALACEFQARAVATTATVGAAPDRQIGRRRTGTP